MNSLSKPVTSPALPWQSVFRSFKWGEMTVPVAVLGVVMAMITPLPAILLDVLISANITLSVIVLLAAMYISRPADFSVFPTTLLLMTLFRLALNISSARLILLEGNTGTRAAGEVIEAFGNFVVGGNYVIGVVIFLVLISIQYVVINHGAVRISEVTARFTLDAMPGKQMSIDSDLNAGLIDEVQARERRKSLAAEAEFYGAMDGASRFTQRDAIASILITGINIIAGFLIGVLQHGLELRRALETYTVLTIGDGLVTVIPALMISVSGAIIITRASSETRLAADFQKQIFGNPQPLLLSSAALFALAAFPGLPTIPFILLGGAVGLFGWKLHRKTDAQGQTEQKQKVAAKTKENIESFLRVEPLAVEVGLGLMKFVEGGSDSPLLRRIGVIRRQLASELGYLLPPVRVTDNLRLKAREYAILIKGHDVTRYELQPGCELAIQTGTQPLLIEGKSTREPAFNVPAIWVSVESAEQARNQGLTVVDPISVLGTHLSETIRGHAYELFTRQDTKKMLDRVTLDNPKAVEDLVPKQLPLATVQKVVQNLLRERVSIRDASTILEALGDGALVTRNPVLLTEFVRQAIRRVVVSPFLTPIGELPVYFIDIEIERMIESGIEHGEHNSHLNLAPQQMRSILDCFNNSLATLTSGSVALTSSAARYFIRQLVESTRPSLAVLAHNEIPTGVRVVCLGTVK